MFLLQYIIVAGKFFFIFYYIQVTRFYTVYKSDKVIKMKKIAFFKDDIKY